MGIDQEDDRGDGQDIIDWTSLPVSVTHKTDSEAIIVVDWTSLPVSVTHKTDSEAIIVVDWTSLPVRQTQKTIPD